MARGWKILIEKKLQDVVYTSETPFIEYLEDLRRINICPEAREFYENAYSENPEYNLGQIIEKYPLTQSWATSMLNVYDGQLAKDVRSKFFEFVTDDMINYTLWKNLKNITGLERKMLREKFRGKLPNVERKL